jgi:hypothetical protein
VSKPKASTAPPVGTLLQAVVGPDRFPLARMSSIDPAKAAALALKAYLECAVFEVAGKPPVRFKLNDVRAEWPESFQELREPAAAITAAVVVEDGHNLSPTALEETLDRFGRGTVLWKTAEQQIDFQVDFWVTNKPEREAVAAALSALFAPTEGRDGIMVQGPHEYYEQTVRLTLVDHQRVDTPESVYERERQLRVTVRADIDVVHLREATLLDLRPSLNGDPVPVARS